MKCDYCQRTAQPNKNTCERCDKAFAQMLAFNDETVKSLASYEPLDAILIEEVSDMFDERISLIRDKRYNDRATVLSAYLADNDLLMNVESVYPHFFTQLDALFFTRSLDLQDALASAHRTADSYVGPHAHDPRFRSSHFQEEVNKYIDFLSEMV